MAFLRTVVTPAGTQAVHEVGLAGANLGEVGEFEDILASLPDIVKSGGDVAASILRTVNYTPPPIPVSSYSLGAGGLGGISGTTMLLVGGGLLAFMMMRKKRR